MRLKPSAYFQKWLLALTLFFSLFSFSGYVAHVQNRAVSVQQTEWVISEKSKPVFGLFSLRSTTATPFCVNVFFVQSFVLSVFNRLDELKFKTVLYKSYSFDIRRQLITGQIITLSSGEEPLSA